MQNPVKKLSAGIVAALVLAALPAVAAAPNGPAPPFSLPSTVGSQVSLAQYKGQVVMINFWASWCGPCRQEMPLLEDIYKKYNKLGFTMIGVNVEPDSKAADDWLKQTPVSFPVLYDRKSEVSQKYDVSGMPSTVIIDRKGNLRYLHHGYKPGDEGEYLNTIRQMIRE
jgi:peroxiredoxin